VANIVPTKASVLALRHEARYEAQTIGFPDEAPLRIGRTVGTRPGLLDEATQNGLHGSRSCLCVPAAYSLKRTARRRYHDEEAPITASKASAISSSTNENLA
jgi:hypothetical protein